MKTGKMYPIVGYQISTFLPTFPEGEDLFKILLQWVDDCRLANLQADLVVDDERGDHAKYET